ncbi:MAG: glutamate 5-kinase [Pseudomonadota bacterium]
MSAVLASARRIVIKVGSALISESGDVREDWLTALGQDLKALTDNKQDVVLVSSGAIAVGRGALGGGIPRRLEEKQAAAAFGQPRLMAALNRAFSANGFTLAQALLTLDDTEHRRRWLNARATLETILAVPGGLPIINENDTVATDEIRYGDNDRLAARVAQMLSADLLVLLSDVDGLYSADPRHDETAQHIAEVDGLTSEHIAMAGGANTASGLGSGGMATKLMAAQIAYGAGCATLIADGRGSHPITALKQGARHTLVRPSLTPRAARLQWLASHLKPEGVIHVDAGAATALSGGSSLLPVGITGVDGEFERGAAIAIHTPQGEPIARGVTAYSARDIALIAGCRSDEVETRLGVRGRPSVVHRDDLVRDNA